MINQQKLVVILFGNIGLLSLFLGIGFLFFGIFNYVNLPYYYIATSGDISSDAQITIIINVLIWFVLCGILILIGIELLFTQKRVQHMDVKDTGSLPVQFALLSTPIILFLVSYITLLFMQIITPIQFFPNILFVDEETLLDLSPIFNALLFVLILSVLYRVAYKLIKYGLKIGGIS